MTLERRLNGLIIDGFYPRLNKLEIDEQDNLAHPFPALIHHPTILAYNPASKWHGHDPVLGAISVGSLLRFGAINHHLDFAQNPRYLPDQAALRNAQTNVVTLAVDDMSLHQILRRKNFQNIDDFTFETMKPVLRLATDLLDSFEVLGFFKGLYAAKRVRETAQEKERFGVQQLWRFSPHVIASQQEAAEAKALLDKMGHCVTWEIDFQTPAHERGALMMTYRQDHQPSLCTASGRASKIMIFPDFFHAVKGEMPASTINPDFDDASAFMRIRFFTAFVIIHEVAHAFFFAWWGIGNNVEPFMNDHRTAELGRALEMHVFGGSIAASGINPLHLGLPFGLRFSEFPDSDIYEGTHVIKHGHAKAGVHRHTYYALNMAYLSNLFRSNFWTDHLTRFGGSPLQVRKQLGVRYAVNHTLLKDETPNEMDFEMALHASELHPHVDEGIVWENGAVKLDQRAEAHKRALLQRVCGIVPYKTIRFGQPSDPGIFLGSTKSRKKGRKR